VSGTLTDDDIERARLTVGIPTPGRSTAWVEVADASSISHFAFGYGDDNPLWHAAGYAQRTRWRGVIAPPLYLIAVGVNETPPLDTETKALFKGLFSGLGKYYAGVEFEWWRPVVPGDALVIERTTSDVSVRESEFSGSRSVIEIYQSLYIDRFGEPVGVRRERYVTAERSGSKQSAKYADTPRQRWTAEQIAELDAVYAAEQRRGAEPRWFEDVAVGDQLVPVMKGPLTMVDLISMHMGMGWGGYNIGPLRYAWQMRRRMPGFYEEDPYGVPDVVQRLHWDVDRANELGLPAPYDYGQMRTAWLSHLVTNWMGDDAWLLRLHADTRGFNFHGDAHICCGKVTELRVEDGQGVADLELAAMNQREQVTCSGSASVVLPSRELGPVRLPIPPAEVRRRAVEHVAAAAVRQTRGDQP
jgi:acyl dehydratase